MSYALDIQITYRTIVAAARARRLVSYADIADAQGKRISRVRDELIGQLAEILCISRRRGWPALTAIVVNRNSDGLEGAALEGFAESARQAGYEVGDPREFAEEQKRAVFETAQAEPDILDLGEGAFSEDPVADSGEGVDSAEASEEPHAAKPSRETRVTAVETKVEGLQENAGVLREDLREFRAETSANFNRLEGKVDSNHRECLNKIDSSHRECMNKIDSSHRECMSKIDSSRQECMAKIDSTNSELHTKIDNSSKELHTKIDNSSRELHTKIDNSSRELHTKIDNSSRELNTKIDNSNSDLLKKIDSSSSDLLKKVDSNHAEVLKKFDERSEKLFDRRLLVHLAIIGAVVTVIVSAMGMLSP